MLNTLINKLKYSFRTRKPVTLNALECQELLEVIERNEKAIKEIKDLKGYIGNSYLFQKEVHEYMQDVCDCILNKLEGKEGNEYE